MPKLEIPDIPESLYHQIEELARQNGVSLEQKATEILAKGLAGDDAREAELLAEARRGREALKGLYVTDAEIQAAKQWGRE